MAPPTPPEMNGQEAQQGLHQFFQQNGRNQAQSEHYRLDDGSYMPDQTIPFTTPEPEQRGWYTDQFGNKNYLYHDQVNLGANIQFVSATHGRWPSEEPHTNVH